MIRCLKIRRAGISYTCLCSRDENALEIQARRKYLYSSDSILDNFNSYLLGAFYDINILSCVRRPIVACAKMDLLKFFEDSLISQ